MRNSMDCYPFSQFVANGNKQRETNANLDEIVDLAKQLQGETNIKPLWGTAQLFMHPRYMHGAATSPEVKIYAYAAAQVKKAIESNSSNSPQNMVLTFHLRAFPTSESSVF